MKTKNAKVIAVVNQKGGVGKSLTAVSLGIGLVRTGKAVLIVDCDPQGSTTISLGHQSPGDLESTLASIMECAINDDPIHAQDTIMHHIEGVDFIPANRSLSAIEMALVNTMNRESILRQCLDGIKGQYDYVIVDCLPSLGMLTVNALVAADSMLIPAQPQFLSMKGLEELLKTYSMVRKKINFNLSILGVLLTMVDMRTNNTREIISALRDAYGSHLRIFDTYIPQSVRASETCLLGKSIFTHDPKGRVAVSYESLVMEVLAGA